MKKQIKKQSAKIINYKNPTIIMSNLKTGQDFKQFAQKLSEVLSALTN
jgi:rRNA maturation protein Rpf1